MTNDGLMTVNNWIGNVAAVKYLRCDDDQIKLIQKEGHFLTELVCHFLPTSFATENERLSLFEPSFDE
jgi:hypothetical protein